MVTCDYRRGAYGLDNGSHPSHRDLHSHSLRACGERCSLTRRSCLWIRLIGHPPPRCGIHDGCRPAKYAPGSPAHLPFPAAQPTQLLGSASRAARSARGTRRIRTLDCCASCRLVTGSCGACGGFHPLRVAKRREAAPARARLWRDARWHSLPTSGSGKRARCRSRCGRGRREDHVLRVVRSSLARRGTGLSRAVDRSRTPLPHPARADAGSYLDRRPALGSWSGYRRRAEARRYPHLYRPAVERRICYRMAPFGTRVSRSSAHDGLASKGHILGGGAGHSVGLCFPVRRESVACFRTTRHRRSRVAWSDCSVRGR